MSKQEVLKVVPARYPLRLIGALFSLFILAAIVQSVAATRLGMGRVRRVVLRAGGCWQGWGKPCC